MDLRTLTKLLLKLMGLYWLTASLVGALSIGALVVSGLGHDSTPYRAVNLVGYLIVGAALLWFPGTIANRVLRIEGAEMEGAITAERLLGVGVSLLGVYFTVESVSAIIFSIGGFGDLGAKYEAGQAWALAAWVARMLIGLVLVFARRRIVSIISSANDR